MVMRVNDNKNEYIEDEFTQNQELEVAELMSIKVPIEERGIEDTVTHYFKEASQIKLLNAEDEKRLAALVENGYFLAELESAHKEKTGNDASALHIAYEVLLVVQKGLRLLSGATEKDRLFADSLYLTDPGLSELLKHISKSQHKPANRIRKTIINYSIARRVTPDIVWDLLKEKDISLTTLPSEARLKSVMSRLQISLESHYKDVKQKAKKAEEQIIVANLRLVISVARKYVGHGLPLLDLVQEGNTGLMRAVQKFDYHRGYKFSTYATWWIRQSVVRALAGQRQAVRIPVHMVSSISQYIETRQRLYQEKNHKPNINEIAEHMGISLAKAKDIERALLHQSPASLEQALDEEYNEGELGDLVPSDVDTPEEIMAKRWMEERVDNLLNVLTPKERRVLDLRFGITDGHQRTLDEVGTEFNLTRERIRQIEMAALRKLRSPMSRLTADAN